MFFVTRRIVVAFARAAFAPLGGGPLIGALHTLLVLASLVGLWWVNNWLGLDRVVHAPTRIVRELWLPILFLIGYSFVWMSWWTRRVYLEPRAASPFPEIDHCWNESMAVLRRSGVAPVDRPLTLILGQPACHESDLVAALGLSPTVGPAPAGADASLRVFADDESIYVLCHEPSLASTCTEKLLQRRRQRRIRRGTQADRVSSEESLPVALRAATDAGAVAVSAAPVATAPALAIEQEEPPSPGPLFSQDESTLAAERFDHLLKLIAADRDPRLPIDAVAVVFPVDGVADAATARDVGSAVQQDLTAIEQAGVQCPVTAIAVDLQHLPGAGQLLHSLSPERRRRRYGAALPIAAMSSEEQLRESIGWVNEFLTLALCGRLYQFEAEGGVTVDDNVAIFNFQNATLQRTDAIIELLATGLETNTGGAWPLAGFFLVATGDSLGGSQAFGEGVLGAGASRTSYARWTPEALERDKKLRGFVSAGYLTLAAAGVATFAALIW